MGNEGSTQADTVDVVLYLNDIRNIPVEPGERTFAYVRIEGQANIPLDPGTGKPALLTVSMNTILQILFWKERAPIPGSRHKKNEAILVGQVVIPINAMYRRCHLSLYHTWFIIEPIQELIVFVENDTRDLCEVFDLSMYDAARAFGAPEACITIVRESDKLRNQVFPQQATEADKVSRYECLIQSHNQHLQLCQTLFTHVIQHERVNPQDERRGKREEDSNALKTADIRVERKKEKIEALRVEREAVKAENQHLRKQIEDLQVRHRMANERAKDENDKMNERNARLVEQMTKMNEEFDMLSQSHSEAPQEIVDNLTREANQRIEKANLTINQLRAVLGDRAGEAETFRENSRISEEKLQESREEVAVIKKQKNELLKIVEDLFRLDSGYTSDGDVMMTKINDEFEMLSQSQSESRPPEMVNNLTSEANLRIDNTNQTINQLRAVLVQKADEIETYRETAQEAEKKLQTSLQEITVIKDQKNALMKIVEELYCNTNVPTKPTAMGDGSNLMLPDPNDISV